MKKLRLFTGPTDGAYTFSEVLAHHKKNQSPDDVSDGVIWLCEHPDMDKIKHRINDYVMKIRALEDGMIGQGYTVWTCLDEKAHYYRCRAQLLSLCLFATEKSLVVS